MGPPLPPLPRPPSMGVANGDVEEEDHSPETTTGDQDPERPLVIDEQARV